MIDRVYLRAAVEAIQEDSTGPHLVGRYSALYTAILVREEGEGRFPRLSRAIQRLAADLWDALTVVWRVDGQRSMALAGHLDDNRWMYFVGTDVRELHVVLRAFYDCLCFLISPALDSPGEVPLKSFERLRNWVLAPGNAARIGDDLASEIAAAEWFRHLRPFETGWFMRAGGRSFSHGSNGWASRYTTER
jgi:hypothetical protein